jgi:hypothetical protein
VKKKMPPGIKVRIYLAVKIAIAFAEGGMRFTFPPYAKNSKQKPWYLSIPQPA